MSEERNFMIEEIRGAVARGWCAPANSHKVMDGDLAEAISQEILTLIGSNREIEQPTTFLGELERLVNKYSRENASDTPDFILADYMDNCLIAYNSAVYAREKWYGRKCGSGKAILDSAPSCTPSAPPPEE